MYKRILVIDDDKDLLEMLKAALVYENFEVVAVDEVKDIFELVNLCNPNLILMDYILAGVNGGELCHQVKCNPKTNNIPVIIFSAYHRVIKSLGYYGCDAFIEKPFDLDELTKQINDHISYNDQLID